MGGGENKTEQALENARVIEGEIIEDNNKKKGKKGIRTKETSGFMLGLGNVFGYTLAGSVYGYYGLYGYYNAGFNTSRAEVLGGELLAGWKWFFGQRGKFGMRLYGRYEFIYALTAMTNHGSLNYDLLFNFNTNRPFKAGMFLGMLIGGGRTDYSCLSFYEGDTIYGSCSDFSHNTYDTKFSIGLNLGFRFVIFDHSAIELVLHPRYNFVPKFVVDKFEYPNATKNEISFIGMMRFIYTF